MSQIIKISKADARKIACVSSGLHQKEIFGKGQSAISLTIRQLGYVQIDTISVVQRAHHHVIWSRVPCYKLGALKPLQLEKKDIFEFWSHAAAYLPMEDYRFTLPKKRWFKEKRDGWPKSTENLKKKVLERIKAEGPIMARDFESTKIKGTGWWDWKPAKLALERLFLEGDLMITQRKGFQKVYELPERFLPSNVNTIHPTSEEYAAYLIRNALKSFGILNAKHVSYLRPGAGKIITQVLEQMANKGQLDKCQINRVENNGYYISKEGLACLSARVSKKVKLLSPFDNLIIQRKRTQELFDFNYQLECYVPKTKRVYGYFSLPILYGDQLIGRVDCKADRKVKTLQIINLVFENKLKISDKLLSELAKSFHQFSYFNDCEMIQLHKVVPQQYTNALQYLLSSKKD